eukprot:1188213-Prorocentrum_minimum.AAC.2
MALDRSCQVDLCKDSGHAYFVKFLDSPGLPGDQVRPRNQTSPGVDGQKGLLTLVHHSAHGISNIPPNILRIFPADRLPLAGRQSTPGLGTETRNAPGESKGDEWTIEADEWTIEGGEWTIEGVGRPVWRSHPDSRVESEALLGRPRSHPNSLTLSLRVSVNYEIYKRGSFCDGLGLGRVLFFVAGDGGVRSGDHCGRPPQGAAGVHALLAAAGVCGEHPGAAQPAAHGHRRPGPHADRGGERFPEPPPVPLLRPVIRNLEC